MMTTTAFTSTATRALLASYGRRSLSTQGQEAVGRLKDALEQYRVQNYQQEIPSRFKKDMVTQCNSASATTIPSKAVDEHVVAVDSIEQLLQNIGVFGKEVTHDDVETIVSEYDETRADSILSKIL